MTTRWQIPTIWPGATVAILGNGPAMTQALADGARDRGDKTIAVNRAVRFAPWAELFVALDPHHPFWADADIFDGLKVCGVECDLDALYAGMFYETVTIAPGHVVQIRNNFLAAMRIAALAGAAKIVMLGLDTQAYDETHGHTGFYGFTEGFEQIVLELLGQGIEVVEA